MHAFDEGKCIMYVGTEGYGVDSAAGGHDHDGGMLRQAEIRAREKAGLPFLQQTLHTCCCIAVAYLLVLPASTSPGCGRDDHQTTWLPDWRAKDKVTSLPLSLSPSFPRKFTRTRIVIFRSDYRTPRHAAWFAVRHRSPPSVCRFGKYRPTSAWQPRARLRRSSKTLIESTSPSGIQGRAS